MTLARSEREWTILVNEYNVCKKKLNSKREALKILTSDLELCQRERDIYKSKIKQLLKEVEDYKRKEREQENKQADKNNAQTPTKKRGASFCGQSVWEQELQNVRERKQKTLSQLLCESRGENKALIKDLAELRQLYRDAQEDIQLLHDALAKQKNCNCGLKAGANGMDPRQDLISQLEENQEKLVELGREKLAISDEKAEIAMERDHYKDKSDRLNTQLNFILGADDRRLVDIDSVLMENRYLKEQIKQLKEEKSMAVSALARYKNTFEKRKNKILQAQYPGSPVSTNKHAMPSLISDFVGHLAHIGSSSTPSTVADLQFLANSLSETLSEKDTALQHLRSANKILGHRVAELEKKLKTLEVSGLWSLQGHRGYGSTEADMLSKEVVYDRLQALIPEEERRTNGNSKTHETVEHENRRSEPDSPSSPGSPGFELSSYQGEVEEGVLVNVTGSPIDTLEELGCVELDYVDSDEVDDILGEQTPVQVHSGSPQDEEEQQEEKPCREEDVKSPEEHSTDKTSDFERCEESNHVQDNENSLKLSSLEIHYHTDNTQDNNEDPDENTLSDLQLVDLLKTINSSD
ncbi:unnamed protein product [Porites evermanni]|uniref:Coiled-coil domain-containing protein 149 n=1 Tax=Porites evermanni TaxID=104178 RepID=A0ABN8LLP0_9CNID|nr:unnamed protein product [Porites evermanni]